MFRLRAKSFASAALVGIAACSSPEGAAPDAGVEERAPLPRADAAITVDGPTKLSATGLYADLATRTLAPSVLEFSPKYPLWSDGSGKRRFLLLPEGTKIDTTSMDDWVFPVGTKTWKEFVKNGVLVETRFLWKKSPTTWFEVAYVWLDDESDAIAVPNGTTNARGTGHDVPEQVKCRACHDNVIDTVIGVSALQLSNGGSGFLTTLAKTNRLTQPPVSEFTIPGSPPVREALGYLHGNCGGCHNDRAKFEGQTALRLVVLTTETTVEATGVYRTGLGSKMVHPIPPDVEFSLVAGDPDRSGIYVRMQRRDGYAMPPHGTKVVDDVGSATVRTWITSMSADASPD